jgi:hypothetical protein
MWQERLEQLADLRRHAPDAAPKHPVDHPISLNLLRGPLQVFEARGVLAHMWFNLAAEGDNQLERDRRSLRASLVLTRSKTDRAAPLPKSSKSDTALQVDLSGQHLN